MKIRSRRLLAVLMAASMLTGQSGFTALAEAETETAAVQAEAPAETAAEVQTEAPAPVTEAPTEAPATEAPATEAPATEAPTTEAPATETPATEAPATEAPVTEAPATENPSGGDDIFETEAPTENVTEKVTEKNTEKTTEKETEEKKQSFSYSDGKLNVSVTLEKKYALPASAKLQVSELSESAVQNMAGQIRSQEVQGHRELAVVHYYEVTFTVDGKQVKPEGKVTVKADFKSGLDLGLVKYAQGAAKLYVSDGSGISMQGSLSLNNELKVAHADVTLKNSTVFAAVGVQNHQNNGDAVTKDGLESALNGASQYAVVTRDYTGSLKKHVETEKAADILSGLSDYSVSIANGVSSDSVTVVNIYAREDGTVDTEPMDEILLNGAVDVSDETVLVNVIAAYADQSLRVPVYTAVYQGSEVSGDHASYAGRIVYNLAAQDGSGFGAYTGSASLEGKEIGTCLAPDGIVDASSGVLGAVYAAQVTTDSVEMAVVGKDGIKATEKKDKKADEKETAADDKESETVSETTETEQETEALSETAETENLSEAAETEQETEMVSETAETETSGETSAESESELATEAGSEAESENTSEAESESETEGVIEETELETESESEDIVDPQTAESEQETVVLPAASVDAMRVKKVDAQGQAVAGAELVLEAAKDVTATAEVTVTDFKTGKTLTYRANQKVYSDGQEICRWTTTDEAAGMEISQYLATGGSYRIREVKAPDGYTIAPDQTFTVETDKNKKAVVKSADGKSITEISMIDYEIAAEGLLTLAIGVRDTEDTTGTVYLDGAEFAIKDADGAVLTDKTGNPYTFRTVAGITTISFDTGLYEALTKDLENGSSRVFTAAQIKAKSGYQMDGYTEAQFTISKDENGGVTLTATSRYEEQQDGSRVIIFRNKKVSKDAKGSIAATVRSYYNSKQIYATTGITHYVALFSDKEKTNRISDVKKADIKKGYKAVTVKFENLEDGTYYVGETDAYGNLVGTEKDEKLATDLFYVQYLHNSKEESKIVLKTKSGILDADPETISINNQYFKLPKGFVNTATFQVTMELKDASGQPMNSNSTFYAGIYTKNSKGKYQYIGKKTIKMGGSSSKTIAVELSMSTATKDVTVREVDADGNEITDTSTYKVTVNPAEITLDQNDTTVQTVTITKTRVAEETETETEPQPAGDGKAVLKLTKRVMYKNTAIRVNSVYYIGIFDDAELTHLRYKKAMTLSDASELTATLKVNLNKVSSKKVTFYFAEVDENGKVLTGG